MIIVHRSCFCLLFSLSFVNMLATIYASRLLQLHLIPVTLPISLNSFDREGVRLLSPRDSQILPKPVCRCRCYRAGDATKLRRSLMKILSFVLFRFQLISSGAQLGSIGDLCSIWGSLLLFWFRSRTMCVFWMMYGLYLCIV